MGTVIISPDGANPILNVGYETTHTGWSGDTALYQVTLWVETMGTQPGTVNPRYGYSIKLGVYGRSMVTYKDDLPETWSARITNTNGYWTSVLKNTKCNFETDCPGWSTSFSISYSDVVQYTVSYNANQGSGAPNAQTKDNLKDLILSSTKPTRTNYKFINWNTKADGSGTSYSSGSTYSGNENLTLYAQWEIVGPSIILDANIYFNTDNNYLFPGTGATASWTKFTSNAKYNDPPNEYQTEAKVYTPNSNHPSFSIRGTPYTHAGKFGVEFCGYYTGKDWTDPGIQVYAPKFDWLYGDNRNYATIAVPNTEYFGSLQSFDEWTSDSTINFYTAADSYYATGDDILEQISSDSLYVPKINSKVTSPPQEGLPQWLITGSGTYTFYALWSKPNLTFTYNPGSGTAPENNENIQLIGTPGPVSETDKVQSFTIKTFQQTGITPPIGYKFKEWNTSSDGTGQVIAIETIQLGGYLNDVTLYAQYEQYHHTINIHGIENTTVSVDAYGGKGLSLPSTVINAENPDNPTLKFAGVFDANGVMVFNKNGTAVNGNYFTNGLWDYKSDDTSLNLYVQWAPPTNAYINDNETWKPALIYINKNSSNPSLEPDWELVDMAEFLNNN